MFYSTVCIPSMQKKKKINRKSNDCKSSFVFSSFGVCAPLSSIKPLRFFVFYRKSVYEFGGRQADWMNAPVSTGYGRELIGRCSGELTVKPRGRLSNFIPHYCMYTTSLEQHHGDAISKLLTWGHFKLLMKVLFVVEVNILWKLGNLIPVTMNRWK